MRHFTDKAAYIGYFAHMRMPDMPEELKGCRGDIAAVRLEDYLNADRHALEHDPRAIALLSPWKWTLLHQLTWFRPPPGRSLCRCQLCDDEDERPSRTALKRSWRREVEVELSDLDADEDVCP